MSPKVSILVPIFNTEKYLKECLDSLLNQTLKDIQIVMVDDGSTDNSRQIAQSFVDRDNRFELIHQENAGSAAARNAALARATGEYVIVCDSDDWVEENMYELMYRCASEKDADFVSCGIFANYPNKQIVSNFHLKSVNVADLKKEILSGSNNSTCNKLIRHKIITENNIHFETGINLGEDALFLYKILRHIKKVASRPTPLYHYRRTLNSNTYTNSITMDKALQLTRVYRWLSENYDSTYTKYKHIQALKVAFAMLRARDTDYKILKNFIKDEIKWKNINESPEKLRSLLIYSAKVLPLTLTKWFVKNFYPLFYK